ncbi:alpha/beta fold hydrolase [Streptomyces triticirhizae]|uniref:Alpha/beta hydrolase n=1 Tax=Streptomyces triticirhizae TaxID=2483353 RepID=A0A3M2L7Z0_9ACTN|nr:alpha/beta hydrolase [Streptomyces triticirhizae]RMI33749.1 alpha/beta hydrolase [Streptomyces triticirhizae]
MSQLLTLDVPVGARVGPLVTARGDFAAVDARPATPDRCAGTVLLVPGFMGSKEDFLPLLAPLSRAGLRAVAIDGRGQYETARLHRSGPSASPDSYALDQLAGDLVALAESLGGGPVHLLGHSYGGLIARAALLRTRGDAALWRSLTLMNFGPGAVAPAQRDRLRLLLAALDSMTLADIWPFLGNDASDGPAHVPPEVRDFSRTRWLANDPAQVRAAAEQLLEEPDRSAELAELDTPVAVVSGSPDLTWPAEGVARMAHALGARLVTVPDGGHSPNVHAPERTAAALVEFWRSLRTPSAR